PAPPGRPGGGAPGAPGGPKHGGLDLDAFGDGPPDRTVVDVPGDRPVAGPRRTEQPKHGEGEAPEHRVPTNGNEPDSSSTAVIPRFGRHDDPDE
ncbi:hypothetical protein AB0K34_30715, partial [Actinomadura sp. NPDC049382]